MRNGIIYAAIALYLSIFLLERLMTGNAALTNVVANVQAILMHPDLAESSDFFTQAWTVVKNLKPLFDALVQIFTLYEPTLFGGNMAWVWWYLILPFDVSLALGLVFAFKGNKSV